MNDAQKKYDALDLIITSLREHEKKLDSLIDRLDKATKRR